MRVPSSATREEYINFLKIYVNEIVEYDIEKELEILRETREKAERRCRF